MKRILFYTHFNKYNKFDNYVAYQLEKLHKTIDYIFFVSNSKLYDVDWAKIKQYCNGHLFRENKGFDFAAYRDAFEKFGYDRLAKFDEVIIMNDTCFGPIYPVEKFFCAMDAQKVDFWGLTDHVATPFGMPGTNGPVPYHIQSYFMCFKQNVVRSSVFHNFWVNVKNYQTVEEVIAHCETVLTNKLANAKFTHASALNSENYSRLHKEFKNYNYSELQPLTIIKEGIPFLKIKSLKHVQYNQIRVLLKERSKYPTKLIDDYVINRYTDMTNMIEERDVQLKEKSAQLDKIVSDNTKQITWLHDRIGQKDQEILKLLNSRTYKVVRLITYPIRKLVKK